MLTLVPTVQTFISKSDFVETFARAWIKIYNTLPTKAQVAVVFSQWMVETAGSYCWCYNICNIKAVDNPNENILYCMLKNVWEIENGIKVTYQPPDKVTWFRAFNSLSDGMDFYVNFVRNRRYKAAWAAVEQGDPAAFAHLLKVAGYYTAPEANYVAAMMVHFNKFIADPSYDVILHSLQERLTEAQTHTTTEISETTVEVVDNLPKEMTKTVNLNFLFSLLTNIFSAILNLFRKK